MLIPSWINNFFSIKEVVNFKISKTKAEAELVSREIKLSVRWKRVVPSSLRRFEQKFIRRADNRLFVMPFENTDEELKMSTLVRGS